VSVASDGSANGCCCDCSCRKLSCGALVRGGVCNAGLRIDSLMSSVGGSDEGGDNDDNDDDNDDDGDDDGDGAGESKVATGINFVRDRIRSLRCSVRYTRL
jgi:hypothetical protein